MTYFTSYFIQIPPLSKTFLNEYKDILPYDKNFLYLKAILKTFIQKLEDEFFLKTLENYYFINLQAKFTNTKKIFKSIVGTMIHFLNDILNIDFKTNPYHSTHTQIESLIESMLETVRIERNDSTPTNITNYISLYYEGLETV